MQPRHKNPKDTSLPTKTRRPSSSVGEVLNSAMSVNSSTVSSPMSISLLSSSMSISPVPSPKNSSPIISSKNSPAEVRRKHSSPIMNRKSPSSIASKKHSSSTGRKKPSSLSKDNLLLKPNIISTSTTSTEFSSSDIDALKIKEIENTNEQNARYTLKASDIIYVNDSKLGEGGGGSVVVALYKGEKVAIKSPVIAELNVSRKSTQSGINDKEADLFKEKMFYEKISDIRAKQGEESNGKYIINYYGSYSDEIKYYAFLSKELTSSGLYKINLVMDYANLGSLKTWIYNKSTSVKYDFVYTVASHIVHGLAFLHDDAEMLHCDMKTDNVLLHEENNNVTAKICDFGISKDKNSDEISYGTLKYIAPEVLTGMEGHSEESDVYSVGLILWAMFEKKEICDVIEDAYNFICDRGSLPIPANMPEKMVVVMKWCGMFQRIDRPKASMVAEEFSMDMNTLSDRLKDQYKIIKLHEWVQIHHPFSTQRQGKAMLNKYQEFKNELAKAFGDDLLAIRKFVGELDTTNMNGREIARHAKFVEQIDSELADVKQIIIPKM